MRAQRVIAKELAALSDGSNCRVNNVVAPIISGANLYPIVILSKILSRLMCRGTAKAPAGDRVDAWLQGGYRLQRERDFPGARRLYQRAVASAPDNVDAHYLLGSLLGEIGELEEAVFHLEGAITLNPDFADAHAALGNVLQLQCRHGQALVSYKHAVKLDSSNAATRSNLGLLYQTLGDRIAAEREFRIAYQLAPELPDLLRNLTLIYIDLEKYDTALEVVDTVLAANSLHADALKCKGFVLQKMHEPDQALDCYMKARCLLPADPELLNNMGIVLQDLGRLDAAIECYNSAILHKPDFHLPIWHRSVAYLLRHDFARGWPDYELRTMSTDQPKRTQYFPQWTGDNLNNKGILVYAEQGLGDEIMFASCLPDIIATSRRCIVECSPKLETLFRRSFPTATVIATAPSRELSCGAFEGSVELQTAIGSLPRYLRRTMAEFPRHVGYLRADAERMRTWRERLSRLGTGLKVGISWQGGTDKTRRQIRSLAMDRWLPILRTPGAHFVSLQYTDCRAELSAIESGFGIKIHDWQEVRDDYEHTAALASVLDLVISVCTAVIHLGGALGRPVWIMTPYSPEWRYGISGESMPWYPSSRIFRQPAFGLWEPVVDQVSRELAILAVSENSVNPVDRPA